MMDTDEVKTDANGNQYIMIPIYEECGSEEAQTNGCYQIIGYRKEYL